MLLWWGLSHLRVSSKVLRSGTDSVLCWFLFIFFTEPGWKDSMMASALSHPSHPSSSSQNPSSAVMFTYIPVLIRPEVFLFSFHSPRQGLNYGHTRRATSQHTTQMYPVHQVTHHVMLRVCTSSPQLACQATVASAVVPIS